jgi:hypothetical protein
VPVIASEATRRRSPSYGRPGLSPPKRTCAKAGAIQREKQKLDCFGAARLAMTKAVEFRANHSYPVLKKFRPMSYLIIFNLNGAVSYRDRGAGRTVNTPVLS